MLGREPGLGATWADWGPLTAYYDPAAPVPGSRPDAFLVELFSRDFWPSAPFFSVGTWLPLVWFDAPPNDVITLWGISVVADQVESLSSFQLRVCVGRANDNEVIGVAAPYFGVRYGEIGDWGARENCAIDVPAGQRFQVEATPSQNQPGTSYVDNTPEFTVRVWGVGSPRVVVPELIV